MKVMCITAGKQNVGQPKVQVGNTYTVTDYTYGWEMMHPKTGKIFYQLAEMNDEQRFWSGLFAEIIDVKEKCFESSDSSIPFTANK